MTNVDDFEDDEEFDDELEDEVGAEGNRITGTRARAVVSRRSPYMRERARASAVAPAARRRSQSRAPNRCVGMMISRSEPPRRRR